MRVFLDANVLFSASNSGSAISRMFYVAAERTTLVASDLAVLEAQRNLERKRSSWLSEFHALLDEIELAATTLIDLPVELAEKDRPILSAAIGARCDYFVTGDRRDFEHLFDCEVLGVTVITPLRLGELILSDF